MSDTMRKNCVAGILGIVLALLLLEMGCQVYAFFLGRHWDAIRKRPGHYYAPSENPLLVYELKKGFRAERRGRLLQINDQGIRSRDQESPANARKTIAILGDSVVFGTGFSQEETIASLLEEELNRAGGGVRVLNFGTPGYALPELSEYLKIKSEIYHLDQVAYVLNPNDFSRRDTVYEGADNGLYRMYRRPRWKTPWFVRKAIYRIKKRGRPVSIPWYRWLYAGNRSSGLDLIAGMARLAEAKETDFFVVLLPSGDAYAKGHYELSAMYAEICSNLSSRGIYCVNPVDEFGKEPDRFFDEMDHLRLAGNVLMARILARESNQTQ